MNQTIKVSCVLSLIGQGEKEKEKWLEQEAVLCSIESEWAIWVGEKRESEFDDEPGVEASCGAEAMVIIFPSPSPSPWPRPGYSPLGNVHIRRALNTL